MNRNMSDNTKFQIKNIKKPKSHSSILSIGILNMDFELIIMEEDIKKYSLNIESLNDITQLKFLKETKNLWKRIQIKTKVSTINTLLYINRTRKTKIPIEFIAYKAPHYSEKDKFISELINKVAEYNGIYINYSDILPSSMIELSITLRSGNLHKKFLIGTEGAFSPSDTLNEKNDLLSPVIQNDHSPLSHIILQKSKYAYFFIDYHDLMTLRIIKGEDFVDFIFWLKKLCETNIIISFPNISHLFNSKESIVQLFHLWYLTDTFIQTLSDANANFNSFNTFNGNKSNLEEKDIDDFWQNKIAMNGFKMIKNCPLYSKINIIINEFSFVSFTEVSPKNEVNSFKYDLKPYPKQSYQNIALIENYKNKLNDEKPYFLSMFIGGLLGRICKSNDKVKSVKVLYPAYLAGIIITKRIIESVMINNALPVSNSFYIVKLNKAKIKEYIDQLNKEQREKKFVLDCLNETHSQMKYYVPLIDENISSFLTYNKRKELKTKGFINDKNYLMYDPIYRSVFGSSFLYEKSQDVSSKVIQNELKAKENNSNNPLRSSSVTDLKLPSIQKRSFIRTINLINSHLFNRNIPTSPNNK